MVRMVDDDVPGEDDAPHDIPADAARMRPRKTADAFRTISEVADELHVPQHVLRFWETKFPQVRPLKRGGGRRYYRPEDVVLLRRVADLLYTQGYTIKGVQRLLREGGGALHENIPPASAEERMAAEAERHVPATDVAVKKPAEPVAFLPSGPAHHAAPVPAKALEKAPDSTHKTDTADNSDKPSEPPAPAPSALHLKSDAETERLRQLLTETLHALEELRRLIG